MLDREKVIKGLEFVLEESGWDSDRTFSEELRIKAVTDAITLLKEPEAVEPKTGHWIYLQHCANEGVYCSECHTKMFDRYPMKKKLSQFCGHCGTRMEGQAVTFNE